MIRMSLEEATNILAQYGITVEKNPEYVPHGRTKAEGMRYVCIAEGCSRPMETGFQVLELAKWINGHRDVLEACEVSPLGLLGLSNYQVEWQNTHEYAKNKFKVERFVDRRDLGKVKPEEF